MRVFNFAGCIMDGAKYLTPFAPDNNPTILGLNTEGVVRLLAGETLEIEPEQIGWLREAILSLPEHFGQHAMPSGHVDGMVWSPLPDAVFLTPHARCPDKTVYPIYDGAIDQVLGSTGCSLSMAAINGIWRVFHGITAHVPMRAAVFYATDHLDSSEWKARIDQVQEFARSMFRDWLQFTVEPELAESGGYWAHYSERARQQLWAGILEKL
jgi:hypothetical protein